MSKSIQAPASRQLLFWGIAGVSSILYVLFQYFLSREQTTRLVLLYAGLFGLYILAYLLVKTPREVRFFLVVAVVLRLIFFGGMPVLSDDIYRFLWDGYLLKAGINPFIQLPSEYMAQGTNIPGLTTDLYVQLNSPDYYTIYPPICQGIYWLAVQLFPNSWLGATSVIRALIFLAEVGSLLVLSRLLKKYDKPPAAILLYALNPLVILEFTGNLHFEAFVIFFILTAIYLLKTRHRILSSFAFGFAVITKLLPLMYLPLLLKRLTLPKAILYYAVVGAIVGVSFLPFLNREFLEGLASSLSLYFQTFEFNASIYYLVREIGFIATGYNIIATSGKVLAVISLLSILLYVAIEKPKYSSLPKACLWILSIYLLFTTTVHPWYVLPLVAFSTLTRLRFPVVWSLVIIVSYTGYTATGFKENLWLVALEYIVVAGFAFYEISSRAPKKVRRRSGGSLAVSDSKTTRSS